MTCIEFESLLQAFLDQGSFDDEVDGLRAHREACAPCQESWDRARLLADAIVAWREEPSEVDLVDATLAAYGAAFPATRTVDSEPEIRRVTPIRALKRRRAIAAIVSALALVVVATVLSRKEGAAPEAMIGQRTDEAHQPPRVEPPAEDRTERPGLPDQADVAYGPLARTAAGAIEEFAWMMLPARTVSVGAADEPSGSPRSLLEGWQRQLRPIGQSVGDTFDFLREVGRAPDDSRT